LKQTKKIPDRKKEEKESQIQMQNQKKEVDSLKIKWWCESETRERRNSSPI